MRPSSSMQAFGLVLTGFVIGIIVSNFGRHDDFTVNSVRSNTASTYSKDYVLTAQTDVWDVLAGRSGQGSIVALGQNGEVRVVVQDDTSALYVTTYKPGDEVWQGRLMDVGNDGTVEVADISYGHCEAFTAPKPST